MLHFMCLQELSKFYFLKSCIVTDYAEMLLTTRICLIFGSGLPNDEQQMISVLLNCDEIFCSEGCALCSLHTNGERPFGPEQPGLQFSYFLYYLLKYINDDHLVSF